MLLHVVNDELSSDREREFCQLIGMKHIRKVYDCPFRANHHFM